MGGQATDWPGKLLNFLVAYYMYTQPWPALNIFIILNISGHPNLLSYFGDQTLRSLLMQETEM